jgi:class 3 adenylate cyclase
MNEQRLTLREAAGRVGVSPSTLRRWAESGVIPEVDGSDQFSAGAAAHARIVAREASREGRLGYAVRFQRLFPERPQPRIGITYGATLYRDGDYLGREANVASPVVARARGGEVLATDSVVETVRRGGDHLEFDGIGQVKLKGFDQRRRLDRAVPRE